MDILDSSSLVQPGLFHTAWLHLASSRGRISKLSTISLYFFSAQYLVFLMAPLVDPFESLHESLPHLPRPTVPGRVLSPHLARRVPFGWSIL